MHIWDASTGECAHRYLQCTLQQIAGNTVLNYEYNYSQPLYKA